MIRPIPVRSATTVSGRIRSLVDLQLFSISHSIRSFIRTLPPLTESSVILDVGCGEQPFRTLFDKTDATYVGLDVPYAVDQFGMSLSSSDLIVYDGCSLPIKSGSVDIVLLVEVLEHVQGRETLLREVNRVLRRGGGIVWATIPWSARVHFEPYDFVRLTPFGISSLFNECGMSVVAIEARATTAGVIANKLLVSLVDAIRNRQLSLLLYVPLVPLMIMLHIVGLVAIALNFSSEHDPLGWTVVAKLNRDTGDSE